MTYVPLLFKHLAANPVRPGSVSHVEVRHDDDCPRLRDGDCTCSPIIVTGDPVDRKYNP